MKRFSLPFCGLALLFFLLGNRFSPAQDDSTSTANNSRPVDLAHDKNLYVVGYAHLDTQWRWTYPYVIQNFIRNTLEQNFPLIEKYPDYIFNFTGSRRYEFMKEYYPEDYERLKKYIADGRWFPAGSSVDENDANIPSSESFVRHFLYGNGFFQHEFGTQSEEYMLPDCFGFPASLPTLLVHGRIKGFSTQKLSWGSAVGIPFKVGTWVGPDGSSVIAALDPGAYTGSVDSDLSQSQEWLQRINNTGDKSGVYADYHYYGTGDRGGAPDEGSVKWMEKGVHGSGPVRVISSKADQMFRDITPEMAAKLPTYKGDFLLVNHSAGSLSSQAYMKRWNRQNEQLANAAESASTMAAWLGAFPYPTEALYNGWDLVLGSQMHDIMPGTSLPQAYSYAWNDEVLALNRFASITEHAAAAVVAQLDTTAQGVPIAVYNALPIPREDLVEAQIPFTGSAPTAVTAYNPDGRPVPTQILGTEDGKLRVLFLAKAPSVGYAVYDLRPAAAPASAAPVSVTASSLENARYRVTLNDAGDVSSIFDKAQNAELLSAPIQLSIHTEIPAQYPAWNMDWEDRQKPARAFVSGPAKIRIVESGPARVALEIQRTTEKSVFTQQVRLAAGSDRVEFLDHYDWRTQQASLKADFHLAAANANASYQDKVGVTQRDNDKPNRFEMPLQQWVDLTGTDGSSGATVMSDSKYGSDKPDDHTLRLTLVYTPGTSRGGYRDQSTQDIGRHEVLYALAGHKGDWIAGKTNWQAARLNQPLRAFAATAHAGPLGHTFSFVSATSDQVQVSAIKKAEDSDEVVVRLIELTGQPAPGFGVAFPVPVTAAREIDAQERPIGPANVQGGRLVVDMGAFSIRAFALKLAAPAAPSPAIASRPLTLAFDTDVVSSRAKRDDGAMESDGGAYPAELFPARLTREGVNFELGPTADGQNNALSAAGQTIALPTGFNRVHLLAAAADGDATATIKVGDTDMPFNVPHWTGFMGQWDTRLWDKPIAELDYDPGEKMVGLVPGYIKRTPVAWFCTHHNTPQGDAYYRYSYLFQLSYDLPAGATKLTLPNNPKIRIFAVTASREPVATPAAAPLYDTLADHQSGGLPELPQAGQTFTEGVNVTIIPPLYYTADNLHYTLDGTDPTSSSPTYTTPFFVDDTVNLAVRQIDDSGPGPVVKGTITVHDATPPQLLTVLVAKDQPVLNLAFSKRLNPDTAQNTANYSLSPPLAISSATPAPDGMHVALALGANLEAGTTYALHVSGLKDTSPAGNIMPPVTKSVDAYIVYSLAMAKLPDEASSTPVQGLPLNSDDHWTMNVLVKPDTVPDDRTVICGFGGYNGNGDAGTGRYFAFFHDGIRLWSANRDVTSNSPLDAGRWQMLTATYDGKTMVLYKDGETIAQKDVDLATDPNSDVIVGKEDPWDRQRSFHGALQAFTIRREAMTADEVKKLFDQTKPSE